MGGKPGTVLDTKELWSGDFTGNAGDPDHVGGPY